MQNFLGAMPTVQSLAAVLCGGEWTTVLQGTPWRPGSRWGWKQLGHTGGKDTGVGLGFHGHAAAAMVSQDSSSGIPAQKLLACQNKRRFRPKGSSQTKLWH